MKRSPFYYIGILMFIGSAVLANEQPAEQAPLPIEELKTFNEVFSLIKQHYVDDVSDAQLINAAIKGMLADLDPHSTFLSQDDYKAIENSSTGRFSGVGIEVTIENGFIKVISPIADTPAAKAGIQSGDVITRIDGQTVQGLSLSEATKLMRGEVGTTVNFTIIRTDSEIPIDILVKREYIKSISVRAKRLGDYGHIRVSQFQLPTGHDVIQAIQQLNSQKAIDGLILDLRNNPGGVLSSAVNLSDAFLDSGTIVSTRSRGEEGNSSTFSATVGDILEGKPLIVLINAGSASASEIVAGALQDNKRAVIMGEKSFGKGSVQNIIELKQNAAVKLTTSRYYTPNGHSIQAKGIQPDIVIKPLRLQSVEQKQLHVSEASLQGHLKNNDRQAPKEDKHAALATSDYMLYEALNLLKALTITQTMN